MTTPLPPSKKSGRKPLGDTTMTPAERQRRYREKLRESGQRDFLLTLNGLHLQYVDALAENQGVSAALVLRELVEPALDRYVGVVKRAERMSENGASEETCARFIQEHLYPKLPPIEPPHGQ